MHQGIVNELDLDMYLLIRVCMRCNTPWEFSDLVNHSQTQCYVSSLVMSKSCSSLFFLPSFLGIKITIIEYDASTMLARLTSTAY